MRVVAIREGYDNVRVRQPGDEFEMPDDSLITTTSWFQRAGSPEAAAAFAAEAERFPPGSAPETGLQLLDRYRK